MAISQKNRAIYINNHRAGRITLINRAEVYMKISYLHGIDMSGLLEPCRSLEINLYNLSKIHKKNLL